MEIVAAEARARARARAPPAREGAGTEEFGVLQIRLLQAVSCAIAAAGEGILGQASGRIMKRVVKT